MARSHRKARLRGSSFRSALKTKGGQREEPATLAPGSSAPHPIRNDLVPKLELVERAPGDLRAPARNLRKIGPAHVHEIAAGISSLGFCDPVLIDEHNGVLDGVIRVEAAKLLGLPYIPCIRADHLTASERRLVRMALNRLGEKGRWDFDELKIELEELILDDTPIEITGFSMTEIEEIVLGEEPAAVETGPLAPEPDATPVAQLGDVFAMGDHRILCGDATDPQSLERLMADHQARLVLTDEPYNVPVIGDMNSEAPREFVTAGDEMRDAEFRAFNAAWMGAGLRYLRDGGLFGTFIDWRGYPAVVAVAFKLGLAPFDLIVWAKTNAGTGSLYSCQHEFLPLFKKGQASHINNVGRGKKGRRRSSVWTYPSASSMGSEPGQNLRHHLTIKPVAMLENALLDMTERTDVVLDPFLGSGATLIAAEKTGRCCRGLELDPLYVDVIVRRYQAVTGRQAVLESTGETFAGLALRRQRDSEDHPKPALPEKAAEGGTC
jgi:DNA modification methylase